MSYTYSSTSYNRAKIFNLITSARNVQNIDCTPTKYGIITNICHFSIPFRKKFYIVIICSKSFVSKSVQFKLVVSSEHVFPFYWKSESTSSPFKMQIVHPMETKKNVGVPHCLGFPQKWKGRKNGTKWNFNFTYCILYVWIW